MASFSAEKRKQKKKKKERTKTTLQTHKQLYKQLLFEKKTILKTGKYGHHVKAIAFAWWPFLPIFKIVLFFE